MFGHNFKYTFKVLLRNKALLFWTFAFPIILGTFFNMAFSNITNNEKLDVIDIAIVDNKYFNENEIFKTAFNDLENKDKLFAIKYVDEGKAKELLDSDEVVGYLKIEEKNPKVVINNNGINQTIFKYVTEEILQTSKIIANLSQEEIKKEIAEGNYNIDYEKISKNINEIISSSEAKVTNVANKNLDYVMIEFYTLIAMTCLYGGIIGMVSINQNIANLSNKGKRVNIAPTKKMTTVISSVLASFIIQLFGILILFLYTIFVLQVDYGSNLWLVTLLAIVGSFAGLSMGIAVGSLFKVRENTKTGILLALTMLWCFLSGMMGITMKYVIDKNIPIINKLNPASMITDGFYSLYYYDTLDRYWFNIASLLIFSFILIFASFMSLRRQKYDSI